MFHVCRICCPCRRYTTSKKARKGVDEIITKIESGKYKSEEMVRICKELGKSEAKAFNEESQQYSGEYQSVRTGDDIDLSRANIATLFFAWLVWD